MNTINQFPHYAPEKRSVQWYTPKEIVDRVQLFFNGKVDLDPCSNSKENPNIPCKQCFTAQDDGLSQLWKADTVFMNHPYKYSKDWIPYARKMYDDGHSKELVLLIKFDPSTNWYSFIADCPMILIDHRLKFISGDRNNGSGKANFPSAIIYLGDRTERFFDCFSDLGPGFVPATNINLDLERTKKELEGK